MSVPPRHTLVWLKRDLRAIDHEPLWRAAQRGPLTVLYVIEPAWIESDTFDGTHLRFALESVQALRERAGIPVVVREGELLGTLQALRRVQPFDAIFSHQETGEAWSYARDRALAHWCRHQEVQWTEFAQNGVTRPRASRDGWAARWLARMRSPMFLIVSDLPIVARLDPGELPWGLVRSLRPYG